MCQWEDIKYHTKCGHIIWRDLKGMCEVAKAEDIPCYHDPSAYQVMPSDDFCPSCADSGRSRSSEQAKLSDTRTGDGQVR